MKRDYFLIFVILFCNQLQSINPLLLKGTHEIVSPDYSPVMGLAFWDCGLAEQWYRLSPKYQITEGMSNPKLQKVFDELKTMKNDFTQNLIFEMYHISGGSFSVTNADLNPVKYLKPRHIGQILRLIDTWKDKIQNKDFFKDYQEKLSKEASILEKNNSKLNAEIRKALHNSDLDDVESSKKNELAESVARVQYLNKIIKAKDAYEALSINLIALLVGLKTEHGSTGKQWSGFVTALVGSLKECNDNFYVENSTQGIILGYLLAKSNTRDDLQEYFRGFLNQDSFNLKEERYSDDEVENALKRVIDVRIFVEFADFFALYVYKERYHSMLPNMIGNKFVNYKGIFFSDCMDTAIRMLTNIVTYSLGSNTILGVLPSELKFNKFVQEFYQSDKLNRSIAEVDNESVHQDWIQVVSNVSNCIYKNIIDKEAKTNCLDIGVSGFIPVDIEFVENESGKIQIQDVEYEQYNLKIGSQVYVVAQKKFQEATYLLIPKVLNLVCCELRSNLLNVIIALNYIFDLNLYSSVNDIFGKNFISQNFEKICQKFEWKTEIDLKSLDYKTDLTIPITVKSNKFFIKILLDRHGYITKEYETKIKVNLMNYDLAEASIKSMIISSSIIFNYGTSGLVPFSLFKNKHLSLMSLYDLSLLIDQLKEINHIIPIELKNYAKLIIIKSLMELKIDSFYVQLLFNKNKIIFSDMGFSKDLIDSFVFTPEQIKEKSKKIADLLSFGYYHSDVAEEGFDILNQFGSMGLLTREFFDEIRQNLDIPVDEYDSEYYDQILKDLRHSEMQFLPKS